MSELYDIFQQRLSISKQVQGVWRTIDEGAQVPPVVAPGSLRRVLVALWVQDRGRRALYVTTDPLVAEQARDDFSTLLGAERVAHFLEPSDTPVEFRLQSLSQQSAHVRAVELLIGSTPAVVVTSLQGLTCPLQPPESIRQHSIILRQGQ